MAKVGQHETRPPPAAEPETIGGIDLPGPGGTREFQLLISTADAVTATPLVYGRTYAFGRSAECEVVVNDPSVSRRHASMEIRDEVVLVDLGSRNGTRIDGRRLEPGERATVSIGCVVQLGSASLVLQRGRDPTEGIPRAKLDPPGASAAVPAAPPEPIVGPSGHRRIVADATMRHIYAMVDLVAPTMLGVLILGETGVGKEVFANEVHRRSQRASGPFVQLNCAALPESILEAELFGYEKGAFTGATAAKAGLFEAAQGGTVFLDEVGDMPLATQVKMLRFLESGEVLRLGSVKARRVEVRIISATNRDLNAAMTAGTFRTDLYFRLNGMTFTIPPLRRRKADIAPLAAMFAEVAANRLGRPAPRLSNAAVALLEARPWVGNVRELKNVVERAVVLSGAAGGGELLPEHFGDTSFGEPTRTGLTRPPSAPEPSTGRFPVARSSDSGAPASVGRGGLESEIRELERHRIVAALTACNWNQSQAARELGISRAVLLNRMKVFGLSRPKQTSGSPPASGSDPEPESDR